MEEIKVTTTVKRVKDLIPRISQLSDDTELSFEYIMAYFFPEGLINFQKNLNDVYMKGYMQGKQEAENLKVE